MRILKYLIYCLCLLSVFSCKRSLDRSIIGPEIQYSSNLVAPFQASSSSVNFRLPETNVVKFNGKFEKLTKYDYNEIIEKDFMILKSEHHPDYYYNALWDTISSGNEWSAELYIRGKNGESIFARNYIYPIKDSNNVIKHYVLYNEALK